MPEHPAQSSDIEQLLPAGFRVVKWLGVGNFGKVCRAKGQGGFECAFKIIEMTRGKAVGLKEFRALRVIRRIKPHRNLIEYLGVWLITSEGEILDNADQIEDDDLQKLDVAELIIQMPLAVKSLEVRLKEIRRELKALGANRPPDLLPGIPLPELLPYMRGVAEALDHLHAPIHPLSDKGNGFLIHRDIKPANILIDRTGNVLVADYGVARAVGANVKSTQSGAGTPIYSAPEQMTDKVDTPHPASDQYSLAITYYELRTGLLPFADDVLGDVNLLKRAHVLGKLEFARLPRNEVNVLKRATNRTMHQRYPSCVEFIDELWKANGVVPMQSGFIQRPVPRVPVTESSPDIGLPPPPQPTPTPEKETREKTGSRTPFELPPMPEIKPALRAEEPPPPPKASGTLLLADMFRSTPFAVPPPSEEQLPIAPPIDDDDDPGPAPWQAATPIKKKSKSSIDIGVDPAKAEWHPEKKAKVANDPFVTPGKANWGTETNEAKPDSQPEVELDDAPPPPATWHANSTKKRGVNPLVLIGGGAILAAAVGGGIYVGVIKKDGQDHASNTSKSLTTTTVDPVVTQRPITTGDPISPPPPPPITPVKTPDEASEKFKTARKHLAMVGTENVAELNLALPILKSIETDPKLGATAKLLFDQWEAARKHLVGPVTLRDADKIAEWTAPDGLKEYGSELETVYRHLKLLHPTATQRLSRARVLFHGESMVPVLGMPLSVFPTAGVAKLDELLGKNPPDPVPAQTLRDAWGDALKWDAASNGDVKLQDFDKPREAMKSTTPAPEDRESLREFYRVRLAKLVQRFALKPSGLLSASDWKGLAAKLPSESELPHSPCRELLIVESKFIASTLESPASRTRIDMPPLVVPVEVAPYRKFVADELELHNAKDKPDRLAAAQTLLEDWEKKKNLLTIESRQHAAGLLLATAAMENLATPDSPNDVAKACLLRANELLAGAKEHDAFRLKVRRDLLRAAAFPVVDRKAADAAAIAVEDIASPNPAELQSLWLAFALTRDLRTEPGAADAIVGYAKFSESAIEGDLAFMAKHAKRLQTLVADVPVKQQAEAAKLLQPIVQKFFARRDELKNDDKTLLAELAASAAMHAKTDELEVLNAFVRLEVKKEKLDQATASALHARAKSPRSQTLLALVELRNAKVETNLPAKLSLVTSGRAHAEDAIKAIGTSDPDGLLALLNRDNLMAHADLGRAQLDGKQFKEALDAFGKVESIAKTRTELTKEAERIALPRATCLWFTEQTREALARSTSKADLESVVARKDSELPEARYRLAMYSLYVGKVVGFTPADFHYEQDKNHLVSPPSALSSADWKANELHLKEIPSDRSAYSIEYLEWRACYACAKSNAANRMGDGDRAALRGEALAALDELAKADELCAAVRRIQFLNYRVQTAAARSGDKELDEPEVKALWNPASAAIAALKKHTAGDRLPGSLDRTHRLHEALMNLVKVHALANPESKKAPSTRDVKACLDALLELGVGPAKEAVVEIEALGQKHAIAAASSSFAVADATVAVHAFHFAGSADPALGFALKYERSKLFADASWRSFAALRVENEFKIEPEELKDNPAILDLLIQIDEALDQSERILGMIPSPDDTEKKKLATVAAKRKDLKVKWFDKGLDAAIEAANKASDAGRAKTLRDFKARRYSKS